MPSLRLWHQERFLSHDSRSFSARNKPFPDSDCQRQLFFHTHSPTSELHSQITFQETGQRFSYSLQETSFSPKSSVTIIFQMRGLSQAAHPLSTDALFWHLKPNIAKTELDTLHYKLASLPIYPLLKGPALCSVPQARKLNVNHTSCFPQSSYPSSLCFSRLSPKVSNNYCLLYTRPCCGLEHSLSLCVCCSRL